MPWLPLELARGNDPARRISYLVARLPGGGSPKLIYMACMPSQHSHAGLRRRPGRILRAVDRMTRAVLYTDGRMTPCCSLYGWLRLTSGHTRCCPVLAHQRVGCLLPMPRTSLCSCEAPASGPRARVFFSSLNLSTSKMGSSGGPFCSACGVSGERTRWDQLWGTTATRADPPWDPHCAPGAERAQARCRGRFHAL